MSDERALEVIKAIREIKPEHWKTISETVTLLKGFIDIDASPAIKSMLDGVSDTFELKVSEIFAPLTNEFNALINELLEPLMPLLLDLITWITPTIKEIAKWIQWIVNFLASLNIPGLAPPVEEGVMMTLDQFMADYVQRYPLATIVPGQAQYLYAEYVAAWNASHPSPTRIGGYQI